jgi:hypothetical protein
LRTSTTTQAPRTSCHSAAVNFPRSTVEENNEKKRSLVKKLWHCSVRHESHAICAPIFQHHVRTWTLSDVCEMPSMTAIKISRAFYRVSLKKSFDRRRQIWGETSRFEGKFMGFCWENWWELNDLFDFPGNRFAFDRNTWGKIPENLTQSIRIVHYVIRVIQQPRGAFLVSM